MQRGARALTDPSSVRPAGPRWFEVVLAVALVGLLVVAAVYLLVSLYSDRPGSDLSATDWRGGGRSVAFLVAMAVAGALALVVFAVFAIRRVNPTPAVHLAPIGDVPAHESADASAEAASREAVYSPTGTRLLGLALLLVALLLLGWVYLPPASEHTMVMRLLYPAALAVAVVLLFDKATRAWNMKSGPESMREWLLCDTMVFLLVLGYLSIFEAVAPENYAGLFWDCLHLTLFFAAFWLIDRAATRYRFLLGYGYLTVLPLLLGVWRWANEVVPAEGLSWWSTIWPFAVLGAVFFLLEIVALLADRAGDKHGLTAVKDALFVVIYAVVLIVAIPAAG